MLQLDPGVIIWAWITFFIFMFVLYKTALKPLLNAIANREDTVRNDIEEAKKQREEAQELLAQHKKMITEADAEGQRLVNEAQDIAKKSREEMVTKAREEAAQIVAKAKQEIEKQKEDAIKALKTEIVDLAIGAAEKLLNQVIDKDTNKKVVDEYISAMPKSIKN